MFIQLTTILCAVQMITDKCKCVEPFNLPSDYEKPTSIVTKKMSPRWMQYAPVNISMSREPKKIHDFRRGRSLAQLSRGESNIIDSNVEMKKRIGVLCEQAILDTNRTVISVRNIRNKYKTRPEYKIGFITSYIRQERQITNEFFDLALKFKDHSKVLQQMNVFEYILRSNVNITTLVRQLIRIHIEHRDGPKSTTTGDITPETEIHKIEESEAITTPIDRTAPTEPREIPPVEIHTTESDTRFQTFNFFRMGG